MITKAKLKLGQKSQLDTMQFIQTQCGLECTIKFTIKDADIRAGQITAKCEQIFATVRNRVEGLLLTFTSLRT